MTKKIIIFTAQQNFLLGDIEGNAKKIIHLSKQAKAQGGDLIVFPELTLTAYPPEDLLLRSEMHQRVQHALKQIQLAVPDIYICVGHPEQLGNQLYNAASVFYKKERIAQYHKQHLPNYSVFDEKRYFTPGKKACVFTVKDTNIGITICEDLWHSGPLRQSIQAGAELLLCLNASPFHLNKAALREHMLQERQKTDGRIPIVYVNSVGGQDELVFDGGSFVLDEQGNICQHSRRFVETLDSIEVTHNKALSIKKAAVAKPMKSLEIVYSALVLGTRDYIKKNGFPGALIGVSGGIDSALTLAIAADAIGHENVHAVFMPSRYSSEMSHVDALQLTKNLNVSYSDLSIEPIFEAFLETLTTEFKGLATDSTEENIQARCRGTLLMALSNKLGKLVLTTGNKSEMAVGYATLYGDMAGGYAVLKDVPKTLVFELAHYRNQLKSVIPERIITRQPSAELSHNQTDQDSLPPYPILDTILSRYVEHNESAADIIASGLDAETVHHTIKLIDKNEYKRRQAPPGVRISARAFGRDWRYPITSGFSRL